MKQKLIINNLNQAFKKIQANQPLDGDIYYNRPTDLKISKENNIVKLAQDNTPTIRVAPVVNNPFFDRTNLSLPYSRIERNAWCRWYYKHDPVVFQAINLHAELPIVDFTNECPDPAVKEFFDWLIFDHLNIPLLLHQIALEYWKIGDVFLYGNLNEDEGYWDNFIILNPDYIELQANPLTFTGEPQIFLKPDETLKAIVNSGPYGEYRDLYNQLSAELIQAVKTGQDILLDPIAVSQLSYKASSYELWGTPLIEPLFKVLIYKDRLREAKLTIADRFITPLRIFKLEGAEGRPVTQNEINAFREILAQAEYDPSHAIVFHSGISHEVVGGDEQVASLAENFEWIKYEMNAGLGVNDALLAGEGANIASAEISINVLRERYAIFRGVIKNWLEKKVYKPIAEIQGFYHPRDKSKLIYPRVTWTARQFISGDALSEILFRLREAKLISDDTLLKKLGLDINYETELQKVQNQELYKERLKNFITSNTEQEDTGENLNV